METDELDDLAGVQSKVRSNYVSRFSLYKQHGGTLSLLDSNTGLPPSTYNRQMSHRSSSLSSLSTDSGFPMSCGSPSPTTDLTGFEDIDKKLRRTSNTVTSPTSPKRVTSYKSLPSPTRFISVFNPKNMTSLERSNAEPSFCKFQKSKSLSMSNLETSNLTLHPVEFDSQHDVSKTSTVDHKQCVIHKNHSIYPYSNRSKETVSNPVSITVGEKHCANETDDVKSEKLLNTNHCTPDNVGEKPRNSDTYDSAYPLKTSSPRVSRLSRPIRFPADFRKSVASSSHEMSDCSQPCSRDTMTAQVNAKNAVGSNHGNYSDIGSVKVSALERHNPLRSLKRASRPDRPALTDLSIPGTDRRYARANHTGHRKIRHSSIVSQSECQTQLPFTISKVEDTSKTVRKRIPPGMVADMREMFSTPIKRRQTMPALLDIKKYNSTLQTYEFPPESNEGGESGTTTEMTLTGSSPEINEGMVENTERFCHGDSRLGEHNEVVSKTANCDDIDERNGLQTSQKADVFITVVTKEHCNGSDEDVSDHHDTVDGSHDLQTSELNFYIQNGSILNEDEEESDDDTSVNVLEESSDDSDDTVEECNIYASKDDITFRVRDPDGPPSTLSTPSYIDNILRLSRNSLNYSDVESKASETVNKSENQKKDGESMDSVHNDSYKSLETETFDDSNANVYDVSTSENKPVLTHRQRVNMYSVINEFKNTDKQRRQSNLCTCIDLHPESRDDDNTNTQTKGVDDQRNERNLLYTDRTDCLNTEPGACTGETESKAKSRLKNDKKNEQIYQKGGIHCSRINVLPVAIGNKCTDGELSINNTPTRSCVTFDKPRADDKLTEACPTPGVKDKPEDDHVALTNNTSPQVESKQCRTPAVVNITSVSSSSKPSDYNGTTSQPIDNMPERSAGPKNNFSEVSEYTGGKKITTKTSTTDVNMNETSEEAKQTLAILTEAMSKLNGDNNDDILPEIKQSVAKLDGGNLVITTLTRKIIEEEEGVSSGRGTPLPDYNDVFYVRDHKGNIYMVEDLTEDSQESAYYSSSNVSQENDYNRIHNLRSVGQTNIDHATAEEVLLGLYNQGRSTVKIEEIDENEKQLVLHKGNAVADLQNQFSADSSFNKQSTRYEYDMTNGGPPMPVSAGPRSTSKIKTIKQSYEMTSDGRNTKDGQPTEEDIKMETEETSTIKNMDSSGCKTMSSSFRYQTDASLLPPVIPETTVCAMPPPPVILPPVQPKLVQLDMTPVLPVPTEVPTMSMVPVTTTKVTEKSSDRIVTSTEDDGAKMKLSEHGRPVYKSVALVKGPYETPKWQVTKTKTEKIDEDAEDSKRYKIVRSHASNETQQKELTFQNSSSSRFHEISGCVNRATVNENQNMYKSERVIQMNGGPAAEPKIHRTRIDVASPPLPRMDYGDGGLCEYSESNKVMTTQKFQSEPVFPASVPSPPMFSGSSAEKDMRVVRGNILIKNTMDQGLEQFDDNINMFSKGFNMCKQNPLYQSDEDLQRRLLEEEERERRRQMEQEVAFETCDRYSKTKQVKRDQPPKAGRQHLTSQLLLSKLSNIDVKDIRQHIDVQHHNEDIYGDARFMHADGSSTQAGANNFDSVNENIDLVMRGGKAYITITVTAERYTPIDKEFNVWRKSQAVVTRVIEIDFLANEQRRRLYMSVMERAGECEGEADRSAYGGGFGGQERVLSTKETLDLFSEIMDATEGEGDHEDITVKTKQHRTTLPPHDFLY